MWQIVQKRRFPAFQAGHLPMLSTFPRPAAVHELMGSDRAPRLRQDCPTAACSSRLGTDDSCYVSAGTLLIANDREFTRV
jgi:hypothetical protein